MVHSSTATICGFAFRCFTSTILSGVYVDILCIGSSRSSSTGKQIFFGLDAGLKDQFGRTIARNVLGPSEMHV